MLSENNARHRMHATIVSGCCGFRWSYWIVTEQSVVLWFLNAIQNIIIVTTVKETWDAVTRMYHFAVQESSFLLSWVTHTVPFFKV